MSSLSGLQSFASDERKNGGGKAASSIAGDVCEWPEHPPACSCFYGELAGEQEKLAKYFLTGVPKQAQSVNSEGGGNGKGRGVEGGGTQGNKVGASGGRLGNRGVRGRGVGSSGTRQSKLTFGCAATRATSTADSEERAAGVYAKTRKPEHDAARGMCIDDDRGPSVTAFAPRTVQSSAIVGGHLRSGSEGRGNGVRPVPGAAKGGAETGLHGSSRSGSAEAWKALFGRKKTTPPCEHGEPSIQRTVLKPGPNHNRRFYTCARSAGNWPLDRNARCNFFQWRLDGVRGYKDRPPRDENAKKQRRE